MAELSKARPTVGLATGSGETSIGRGIGGGGGGYVTEPLSFMYPLSKDAGGEASLADDGGGDAAYRWK